MVMSCVLFLSFAATTTYIIPRGHTNMDQLGPNFGLAYEGWLPHVEDPFVAYLNEVFSAFSLFFYMLIFVYCLLARQMRQEVALPGTSSTQERLSRAAGKEKYQSHQLRSSVNPNATKVAGTSKIGPADNGTNWENIVSMLDDKNLYTCSDSNAGTGG